MPRARSASTMRGSIVAGNGAYTGGRAGKWREAVMQGPVEAEINRSSRISPSTGRLYHSDVKRLAFWLPPFVWMVAIAWFSTGDFSAENTGSVLEPLLRWLLPGITAPQIDLVHALIRKAAHLTEYAVLAALWFVALTRERGLAPRRAAWLAFLVSVAWAFLDELHQATEPSRTASALDVGFDAVGALAAAAIGRLGWGQALDVAALACLWLAAAGGVVVIAIDLASDVAPGMLWLTVPAALLALAFRWRSRAARR
jgi:VanZ family protein